MGFLKLPEELRKSIKSNTLLFKMLAVVWILVGGLYIGDAVGSFIANVLN